MNTFYCFTLSDVRPISSNLYSESKSGKKHKNDISRYEYAEKIREAFKDQNTAFDKFEGIDLYGIVYCFYYRGKSKLSFLDADNISKPFWDSLDKLESTSGDLPVFLYDDDQQIKLRIAGIKEIVINEVDSVLSLTNLNVEKKIFISFMNFLDKIATAQDEEHYWIYGACGELNTFNHYQFKLI